MSLNPAFQKDRARQQQLLADAKAEQARQEQRSQTLEDTFEANDSQIIDLERALQDRLGDLKELFGVLQQAAGDAQVSDAIEKTSVKTISRRCIAGSSFAGRGSPTEKSSNN